VSPSIIVGSDRGKELNGSLRASSGSDSSITLGLLAILQTNRPRYKEFEWFVVK
jgi:hypothetical protein